ncbi:hypothetical protein [Streptomyces sp. NRRL S-31]|uniref:hypothetical protein n=1 Tax=Streptomyces sp. NRRL S-31 TaxID=1463898 RepID=UPI0004C6A89E|nr:hypothetical protein [Streptomyces sp. NRRL S-31]
MAENFIVNPDGLQNASVPLRALAERLGGFFEAASAVIADGSKAWGDDKPGRQFASRYVPVARDIIEAGQGIRTVLTTTGENLHEMGKGFSSANENSMQATSRLNGQFGGTQGRGGSGGGRRA